MSIPASGRPQYRLAHPGEHLREDYMPDCGFTVASLAAALGVSRQSINELINERRGVSADMALRLGRLFSQSPEFWLDLQRDVDLWDARQAIKEDLARIKPLPVPPILTEEEFRRTFLIRVSENTPRRKTVKRRTKTKR
ncbi:MAG: HigA family addiction module antidote protein [Gemmatimonadetes bacterium]|nr:HigA family addiction module antidote protein [Gemmatimonadota bacterium]